MPESEAWSVTVGVSGRVTDDMLSSAAPSWDPFPDHAHAAPVCFGRRALISGPLNRIDSALLLAPFAG